MDHDFVPLLHVLEAGRADDPGDALPWALLEGLQRLVPCDRGVSYCHTDHRAARVLLLQRVGVHGQRELTRPSSTGDGRRWTGPRYATSERPAARRTAVFVPSAGARRGPADGDALGTEELSVPLPAPVGQSRRIVFARTPGWAFSERDRAVVALLRPHLQEAWADAEYRRSAGPSLTRRETEVLRLAAAGMSVAEIAEELCLSVGTVRKHAEHIRERLGVHSMAAATALAPAGGPG